MKKWIAALALLTLLFWVPEAVLSILAISAPAWAQSQSFTNFIVGSPSGSPTTADLIPCIENQGVSNLTYQCTPPQLFGLITAAEVKSSLGYTPLNPANNLSDVASASTSRTNLGLGTAATKAASASGDSTVASVSGAITSGHVASFADTSGTVQDGGVLGTAAAQSYTATTWTPTITTTGTAGTPAYTTQVGSYEQIGRQVTVRFNIVLSGWTGSPTGNVEVGGLPVASANTSNDDGVCKISTYTVTGLATSNYGMSGIVAPNASVAGLYQEGNTGTSAVTAAQFGTTGAIVGSCQYHT